MYVVITIVTDRSGTERIHAYGLFTSRYRAQKEINQMLQRAEVDYPDLPKGTYVVRRLVEVAEEESEFT
jgi:hypothetical protein